MADIPIWAFALAILAAWMVIRMLGRASASQVREHSGNGAVIVDVRSPGEFEGDRVSKAVNVPLAEVGQRIVDHVDDRKTPILCYCLSGARSGAAVGQLKRLGYRNALNVGSLGRAKKLLDASETSGEHRLEP